MEPCGRGDRSAGRGGRPATHGVLGPSAGPSTLSPGAATRPRTLHAGACAARAREAEGVAAPAGQCAAERASRQARAVPGPNSPEPWECGPCLGPAPDPWERQSAIALAGGGSGQLQGAPRTGGHRRVLYFTPARGAGRSRPPPSGGAPPTPTKMVSGGAPPSPPSRSTGGRRDELGIGRWRGAPERGGRGTLGGESEGGERGASQTLLLLRRGGDGDGGGGDGRRGARAGLNRG